MRKRKRGRPRKSNTVLRRYWREAKQRSLANKAQVQKQQGKVQK